MSIERLAVQDGGCKPVFCDSLPRRAHMAHNTTDLQTYLRFSNTATRAHGPALQRNECCDKNFSNIMEAEMGYSGTNVPIRQKPGKPRQGSFPNIF